MPKAGGLDDVVQKFKGDNTDYLRAADENVQAAIAMARANKGAMDSFNESNQVMISAAAATASLTSKNEEAHSGFLKIMHDFDDMKDSVKEYVSLVDQMNLANARFGIRQQAQIEYHNDIARVAKASANIQMQAEQEITTAAIAEYTKRQAAAAALSAEIDKLGVASGRAYEAGNRALSAYASKQRSVSGGILSGDISEAIGEAYITGGDDTVAAIGDVLGAARSMRTGAGGDVGRTAAQAFSMLDTAASNATADAFRASGLDDVVRLLSQRAAAGSSTAAARLAQLGGTQPPVNDNATRYFIPVSGEGAAAAGVIPPADGGRYGGGGGGGGDFGGAVLGSLLARSPRDSAAQFGQVSAFLATWYPRIHWAMMATNELLATAGPATVAGLAAAAVGLEGGQTGYTRLSAINTVGQSLGPALGQTPGQFLGIGNALQKAQTAADPMVWEMMGAALNSVNYATKSASGGLGSFWQLGTNTIDMMDRFGAAVTVDFKNGVGKELSSVVQQGTGDLQQFGDVVGNVGKTFMAAVPALPGVGGDILSVLSAGTGAIAKTAGFLSGAGLLGPLLAGEAGLRYGPALVGGLGALVGKGGGAISGLGGLLEDYGISSGGGGLMLGAATGVSGLGGFLGTAAKNARAATAADVAAGALKADGTAAAVGDALPAVEGAGLAGVLGATSGGTLAGLAAITYLVAHAWGQKGQTAQIAAQQNAALSQMSLTQGFGALPSYLTGAEKGSQTGEQFLSWQQTLAGGEGQGMPQAPVSLGLHGAAGVNAGQLLVNYAKGVLGFFGADTAPLSNRQIAEQQAQQYATQFNQLMDAGPAMQKMLGGGSVQQAFDLADMAGIQMSQLKELVSGTPAQKEQIQQQLLNTQRGFKVMSSSPGVYGSNIQAVQAMAGLQGTQLSQVNNAWDQILQNATGGTAAATGFAGGMQNFQLLGGSLQAAEQAAAAAKLNPGAVKQSTAQIAKALSGFSSPASQAAWAAFSSPSTTAPGLLQQAGSMADWMRTAMTVSGGTFGQGQFNQALGYEAKQLLPYAAKSPAATAQLSVLAQQMGYKGSVTDYKAMSDFVDKNAGSQKQFNAAMTAGTIATAGVSAQALNFGATLKQNTYAAMAGGATGLPQVSADMAKFKAAFSGGGAINTSGFKAAAQSIAGDFAAVGASGKDVGAIISQALSGKGLNAGQIASVIKQISGDMNKIQSKNVKVSATVDPDGLGKLKNDLATLQSKKVTAEAVASGMGAIRALGQAIAALQSRTVYATTIVRTITESTGTQISFQGVGSGNETASIQGSPLRLHAQTGYLVPGYGGGDIYPAMLEPGEAVIPKYLVHQIAPFLKAHGIPGFAAGGVVPGSSLSQINSQISGAWNTLDSLYAREKGATGNMLASLKQQVSNFWSTVLDPLYAAKDALHGTTASATNTAAAAKAATTATDKLATTIANKFTTAMNFARGVSGAASAGQGFGTTGLISGMDPTQDTVANQMQTYLTSEKAFTKDLKTLTKGGLNKSLIQQLIAAGPTQGDALAQSILQGGGTSGTGAGISQVNQLWKQIGSASHALGSQAAMSVYGQTIAPNLKSGNVTSNNISINVSVPGGAGANLNLTTAQIKQITEEVQAALLKQAKRNRTTGVALAGKKA